MADVDRETSDRETFDREAFDREALVAALEGLGQEDDAAALRAGREAMALVEAAGLTWDAVIAEPAAPETPAPESPPPESAEPESTPPAPAGDDKAMIGRLLAIKDLYEGTRRELEGYLEDIEAGEFTAADSRYLKALHKRIAKQRKL